MKVYVSHSSKINYKDNIYDPLSKAVEGTDYQLILPHQCEFFNSKEVIGESDIFLMIGYDLTLGMGVELAWAEMQHVPILMATMEEIKSQSLSVFDSHRVLYSNMEDVIKGLDELVLKHNIKESGN